MSSSSADPLRVLYIVGAGRSGSTVLDTVLGNHPDTVSVGELSELHRSAWLDNEYCACGQPAGDCDFWSAVRSTWQQLAPGGSVEGYLALRGRFERLRSGALLRSFHARLHRTRALTAYLEQTAALFEAIGRVSGRRVIVDSSKNPLRAAWLSRIPSIDLRIIHLVRDSRGVAWSRKKALARDVEAGVGHSLAAHPAWYSVVYWTITNLLSARIRRRRRKHGVLVRYEDFVSQPETELARIGRACDLDCSGIARALAGGEAFPVGHTVAGNRLRMAGRVTLKADWEWLERLPTADRRICWALSGWLLKRYGYPRQSRAA